MGQICLVLSGVLLARLLGPTYRGYLALLLLFATILSQIGSLGLPFSVSYYLAKGCRRSAILRRIWGPVALQVSVLVVIQLIALNWYVQDKPAEVRTAAFLSLLAVPAAFAQDIGLGVLQGEQRFVIFNLLRLQIALYNSAAILLLFLAGKGTLVPTTMALMGGAMAAGAIAFGFATLGPEPTATRNAPDSRRLLAFGLKGLLGSVYPVEVFRLDQAIVGLFLSPAALGLYVVAVSITNLPRLIAQGVAMVAYPRIAHEPIAARRRPAVWRYFWLALGLSLPLVLGLEVGANLIVPLFFGHTFVGAVSVSRILLIGAIFMSAKRILSEGLKGAGHPSAGTISEAVSFACLLPLMVALTGLWKLNGVAVAFTISSAAGLVALLAIERKARTSDIGFLQNPH